jgi:hypothetical protein
METVSCRHGPDIKTLKLPSLYSTPPPLTLVSLYNLRIICVFTKNPRLFDANVCFKPYETRFKHSGLHAYLYIKSVVFMFLCS